MNRINKKFMNQSKLNNLLYSLLLFIILLSSGNIWPQQKKEVLLKGIAYRQLEGEGK